jgi:HemY protein
VIRLASWIIGSLAIAALLAWTASLPGTVTLEAAGYRLQPRLGTAVLILVVLALVVLALWALLRRLLAAPKLLARHSRSRRFRQGAEHLADGFIALEAGDATRARLLARSARTRLGDDAAARLLEARADLMAGDMPAAREHYRALIANDRTALAALAGLYQQARTQRRAQAALTFARKALAVAPATDWARAAVFDDLTRRGEWRQALAMVGSEAAKTREARARQRRRQAVLETALARSAEDNAPLEALDHALKALKLLPDFVPAALIAARINAHRGEARKAMSLLRRVWRATGHPDVASLYANAVPGASAVERLKRVRELVEIPPQSRAAAVVLARAASDAFEWSLARNALASVLGSEPSQAVCLLMAEIEEGQNADQGKAREWLARAVKAPRDPVWTADGITADEWEPTSPVSGRLDAFEWKQPVSALAMKAEGDTESPEAKPPALPGA